MVTDAKLEPLPFCIAETHMLMHTSPTCAAPQALLDDHDAIVTDAKLAPLPRSPCVAEVLRRYCEQVGVGKVERVCWVYHQRVCSARLVRGCAAEVLRTGMGGGAKGRCVWS